MIVFLTIIQLLIVAGMKVLNSLCYQKVGVNHSVVARTYMNMDKFISPVQIKIYAVIAAVIILVLVLLFIKKLSVFKKAGMRGSKRKKAGIWTLISILLAIVIGIAFEYILLTMSFPKVIIYMFLLFAVFLIWIFEIVKIIINARRETLK